MNSTTAVAEKLKTLELTTHLNEMEIKKTYKLNHCCSGEIKNA